jgi:High potential iron-sulfur protein
MKDLMSRRDALKSLVLAAGTVLVAQSACADAAKPAPAAGAGAGAAPGLPHVAATDPMAVALAYHENAKSVDAAKFASYKPEQKCSNCQQLQGKAGDAWRPCNLFPGKLVSAEGWCKVYVKKVA